MNSIYGIFDCRGKTESNLKICENGCGSLIYNDRQKTFIFCYSKISMCCVGDCEILKVRFAGREYAAVCDIKLNNRAFLIKELIKRGAVLKEQTDCELVLYSYIIWKEKCVEYLDGAFSICIYEIDSGKLFFARDRMGLKPFFYSDINGVFCFSSNIDALIKSGKASTKVSMQSFWEMLCLSPCFLPDRTVFCDIKILPAGFCGYYNLSGIHMRKYYELVAKPCVESAGECALHTGFLLQESIKTKLDNKEEVAVLLSGGVDSSIIASYSCCLLKEEQSVLDTYSIDFENTKGNFTPSELYPHEDGDFSIYMAKWLECNNKCIVCPTDVLVNNITSSVDILGFPVYSQKLCSLNYFYKEISQDHKNILCGAGADDIFGGHLWCNNNHFRNSEHFPWAVENPGLCQMFRKDTINDEALHYIKGLYNEYVQRTPLCGAENALDRENKLITFLSLEFCKNFSFLIYDSVSRANGTDTYFPYADSKLCEYVYNVPSYIKNENGFEKALLRNAFGSYLPERILYRKKSPFPKCCDPRYNELVIQKLIEKLSGKTVLNELLDISKLQDTPVNTDIAAFFLQLDYWCEKYNVSFDF